MDQQTKQMKKIIFRLKLKRIIITLILIIICVPIILVIIYKGTQNLAGKQSWQLMEDIEVREDLLSPNIESSDNYLSSTSFWGGTVTSHRYKVIDGYRIAWSPLTGQYDWGSHQEDELNSASIDMENEQAYDLLTQQKIPLFYSIDHHYSTATNQLKQIGQSKNSVAEVALTFKRPLTRQQINKLLPDSVEQDWYWLGPSDRGNAIYFDNNYLGFQAVAGKPDQTAYQELKKEVKKTDSVLNNVTSSFQGYAYNAQKYARWYLKKYPQFKTSKYSGIIISGQTQNLARLKNASWIKASSVGAVVKIKPYLLPNK